MFVCIEYILHPDKCIYVYIFYKVYLGIVLGRIALFLTSYISGETMSFDLEPKMSRKNRAPAVLDFLKGLHQQNGMNVFFWYIHSKLNRYTNPLLVPTVQFLKCLYQPFKVCINDE